MARGSKHRGNYSELQLERGESLTQRTLRGSLVNLVSSGVLFVLQFGVTILMARLLSPSDYGQMAMVVSTYGFVLALRDLGLSMAVVQRRTITEEQLTGLFWINVLIGVIFGCGIALTAPLVAIFYGKPVLTYLALGYAVTAPLSCLGAQHAALLRRRMEFGKLAICRQVSWTLGSVVGISAALSGIGVWSLLLMEFAMAATNVGLVWCFARWRPGAVRAGGNVRSLIVFGGKITACNLIGHFGKNIDSVLLGYFHGDRVLGLYNRAQGLIAKPISQLSEPVLSAIVPAVAKKADDSRALTAAVSKMLATIAAGTCLVMPILLVYSDLVVDLLLGSKWSGTAGIIAALAVFGFVEPCFRLLWNIMAACGKATELLKWQFVSVTLILIGISVGLRWGGVGVAVAYSVTGLFLRAPAMMWYVGKVTGIGAGVMFRAVGPFLFFGCVVSFGLFLIKEAMSENFGALTSLLVGGVLAIAAYAVLVFGFTGPRCSMMAIVGLVRHGLLNKIQNF